MIDFEELLREVDALIAGAKRVGGGTIDDGSDDEVNRIRKEGDHGQDEGM